MLEQNNVEAHDRATNLGCHNMKVNFVPIAATVVLGWFNAPVLLIQSSAGIQSSPTSKQSIREEYYHLLEAMQTDSAAAQLAGLQGFLENHAEFQPAYHKLLERYILCNRILEAKEYFQQMSTRPRYRQNSQWMLAKISMLENDSSAAFEAFSQALYAGIPSLGLLNEFVEFDHQQSGKYNGTAILQGMKLPREHLLSVSAFYSYRSSNYERAFEVFSKIPQHTSHRPVILHLWGECAYRLTRFDQADSLWRIGLSNSRETGDREVEAQFLSDLGFLKYQSRKYDLAFAYYDSVQTIIRLTDDLFRMQWLAGERAYIYRDRGDYAKALVQFQEAIRIAVKIGAHRYAANWLKGYAITLYYWGRYSDALQALEQSEEYARKVNNEEQMIIIKLDKGTIYVTLKQHALARKAFQEAYHLAKLKQMLYQQHRAKAKLGEIMLLEGKYSKARKSFQEIIDFLSRNNLRSLAFEWMERLAKTHVLEGSYDLARNEYSHAYETAKQTGSKTFEGWYLLYVANMNLILGNIDAAIEQYNLVHGIASTERIDEMLWEVYLGYGNAYKKSGDLTAAIASYTRAASIIEETRRDLSAEQLRIGYFIEGQQVYQNLVHCYLQRYEQGGNPADLDTLLYYEALSHSRALQDARLGEFSSTQSSEYLQAREQLRSLQWRLRREAASSRPSEEWDALLARLEAARYSLISQRLRLSVKDSTLDQNQRLPIRSLQAILKELKQAELGLLLYHLSEEASFVLAAAGDEVKVVRLQVSRNELASAIDSLITPFHAVRQHSVLHTPFRAAIAHRLYQWLIKPAEEALALPKRLVIVPALELTNLPFEMLLTAPPDSSEYTPVDFPGYADRFLVHRYALVCQPSVTFLQELSNAPSRNPKVLVFANPFGSNGKSVHRHSQLRARTGWRFDPLPFAEVEANRIRDLDSDTRVHKREAATKANFIKEAPQYQVVHIASHAFVDTSFEAFSGLVLAAGSDSTEDGMLMGYDISDLTLQCDLISLSACETGRGQRVAGEGVLGLPRLFMGAGAKTVMMTLWQVDDKFASEMMPLFYDNLLVRLLSKVDALSEAKQAVLNRPRAEEGAYYQHPFYWASFSLYGDPGMQDDRASGTAVKALLGFAIVMLSLIGALSLRRIYRQR